MAPLGQGIAGGHSYGGNPPESYQTTQPFLVLSSNSSITPPQTHFSHPFLGTYEVHQFLDLGYLEGTHSGGGI